jgi:hypothetical protein
VRAPIDWQKSAVRPASICRTNDGLATAAGARRQPKRRAPYPVAGGSRRTAAGRFQNFRFFTKPLCGHCMGNQVAMRTVWRIEFNGVGLRAFSPQSTSRRGLPDVSVGRIIPTGPTGSRIEAPGLHKGTDFER